MSAYHQMGHQTDKYFLDADLANYGLILSPVNYAFDELKNKTVIAQARRRADVIFDPQMYIPSVGRGCLPQWSYYPSDLETADLSRVAWWSPTNEKLIECAKQLSVDALCSPAPIPRHDFSPDYFQTLVGIGENLAEQIKTTARPIQTAVVGLPYLAADVQRPKQTASILSKTPCEQVYLVLHVASEVRRELADNEQLAAAMVLIRALEGARKQVIVAFSSTDMVLWKAAGASHCATGKNMNVRRFTPNRFADEEPGGGAQQPYMIEESLLAFLRRADVGQVNKLYPQLFADSIKADDLNRAFIAKPDDADLNLGWRQFLRWFMLTEERLTRMPGEARAMAQRASDNWTTIKGKGVSFAEPKNDGRWIKPWGEAIAAASPK